MVERSEARSARGASRFAVSDARRGLGTLSAAKKELGGDWQPRHADRGRHDRTQVGVSGPAHPVDRVDVRKEMRALNLRPVALVLVVGLVLVACTPVGPGTSGSLTGAQNAQATATPALTPSPGMVTPVAGTPIPSDLRPARQNLQASERDLSQLRQRLGQLDPQQRERLAQIATELMAELSTFMVTMQQALDRMSPEERQAVADRLRELQAAVQDVQQAVPELTPTPISAGAETEQLARELDQARQQLRDRLQQMDPAQLRQLTEGIAALVSNLGQLMDELGAALSQLTPEQRQELRQQAEQIQDTVREMRDVGAAAETPTPMPRTP